MNEKAHEYKCEYCGRTGFLKVEDEESKPIEEPTEEKEQHSVLGFFDSFLGDYEFKPFVGGDIFER